MTRWFLIAGLLLGARPVLAQEPPPAGEPGRQEAREEEAERANEIAAVVAATFDLEADEAYLTLGVEYERRLGRRLGLIGEVEYVFDAERWIVVAPIVYRPAGGWKLFAGPGFERAEEEEELHAEPRAGEHDDADDHAETRFLFRVGAGYAVEFAERYSVGPSISFDVVRESGRWAKAVVVGLSIGFGF